MGGTLRFSDDGPEVPADFVDALLAGDVIFLCGTGVSAPQMPDFPQLVEHTYRRLAVERTDSEQFSFDQGRFEEVLGSLSRRLSDPDELTRTVSDLLAVPDVPNLDQQRTILRLSRDLDNRISVVTTNFDTLLERAATTILPETPPRHISFAGQALPVPGSASFSGIIHIHGRLRDADLDLEASPLVLTSPDYGDAYMRSGWVARFLFDLARCKTIALVGYSANDAPVRYFLNVLEADRARFPDLKPVYAFDAYERDPEEASRGWGTLGVTPLPYCKQNPRTGAEDHFALWRDLDALADIVDHPKRSRQDRARNILERPATEADTDARRELLWLFAGNHGLWPVAIKTIVDSDWFSILDEDALWSREEATWVIAAWIAQSFEDRARLECACEWQRRLGRRFTEKVEQRLMYPDGLHETWLRVWRLFCLVDPVQSSEPVYAKKRLESGLVLDSDLKKGIRLLTPALTLSTMSERQNNNVSDQQPKLRDLVWVRMEVPDRYRAQDLIDILCALRDRTLRILDLATAHLRSALELESDLDLIVEDFDHNDSVVPSIEPHIQNEHRGGVNALVRLLVGTLSFDPPLDRQRIRQIVFGWKGLPERIGLRLCFHAMRDARYFSADEAMDALLVASPIDFWTIGREVSLLLRDRADATTSALLRQVEQRILRSGDDYWARYSIGPDEVDWRAQARDDEVWLRLNMLQKTGALSSIGSEELSKIMSRREYLERPVDDRDLFRTYVTPARFITGDPKPILEAADDDRLRIARELAQRPEFDQQRGWSAYCRTHPDGALDSLTKGELSRANADLWNNLLECLAHRSETGDAIRDELAIKAFDHLDGADSRILLPMASGLAALLLSESRPCIPNVEGWLDRLWDVLSTQQHVPLDLSTDIYEKAINATPGKIAETLLLEIDATRQKGLTPTSAQLRLLRNISNSDGTAGELGRAILVYHLAFVLAVDRSTAVDTLTARINGFSDEGKALRSVMLSYRSITPELTKLFRPAVLKGAVEANVTSLDGDATIAANVLRPALADVRGDTVYWGVTASDVTQVLRDTSLSVRNAALGVLAEWLEGEEEGAECAWRSTYGPFFSDVWPKEREYRHVSLTPEFIAIAVAAGAEFPASMRQLQPYMLPFDQGPGGLYSISSSQVPEMFPRDTLRLLSLVCSANGSGIFSGMAEILDRLIVSDPQIEVDRRLQWLEDRTERYE